MSQDVKLLKITELPKVGVFCNNNNNNNNNYYYY